MFELLLLTIKIYIMNEYKKDLYGNVFRQDRFGHTDYLGKVQTGYSGESFSSVISDRGIRVGTIHNPTNPIFDGPGNMNVNFNSGWPTT